MSNQLTAFTTTLKQRPVATLALALALVFGLVFFVRGGHLRTLLEEQDQTDGEWSRIEQNMRNARHLDQHVERIESIREEINSRLINPAEVALNYDYFYRIERETGVRIVSINQIGRVDGRQAAGLPTLRNFSAVGYTLSVEGGFPEVLSFLSEMTSGRYLTRVSALNLSASTQSGGRTITANVQCQILGVSDER